ncbi:MAG TPA: quinone oxidoreductase [Amycolatopsis sp.]|uniref:quinone oxidoreductase family protein n=1 Tax=Amycolatopsis sp. TaxID=37632 RepID=UPI002B476E1C|nr:quinone oxidoreductase [Amycolatopsis sp.]HKS45843.1 quinone oxidoreductase [Amycolatopsis sp.]
MRAAVLKAHGGPERLAVESKEVPAPRAGHLLVRVAAAGLNFHDVIERRSGYPGRPAPPTGTGLEGAGEVIAVGPGVTEAKVGDQVAWAAVESSHAQYVEVPVADAIPVPGWLGAVDAAAVAAQGLTAHYLAFSLRSFAAGDTALVWAAAGGVGRLLTQFLAARGVRVIAATSSEVKAAVAREAGAERSVRYEDVPDAVRESTGGAGVDVVFDGIGAPTFDVSLGSVRRRGLLVVYGRAGGQVPPVDLFRLSGAGSVQLVRPRFIDFVATREELLFRSDELFAAIRSKDVTVRVEAVFSLEDIADAHRLLESRAAIGKVVILPWPDEE